MKNFRPCIKGLWSLLRPILPKVLGVSLIYLLEAACSLLFVWYSKKVVDIATGVEAQELAPNVIVLIVLMFLRVVLYVLANRVETLVSVKAKLKIRSEAFGKALNSAWYGKDKFHSADVVNRLEEDIRVVSEFLCSSLPACIMNVAQLIAAVVLLFNFSSSLASILIWIMPIAVLSSRLYFRKLRKLSTEIRTLDGRIQGHIQEHLQSRVLIKSLGAEQIVEDKLDELQGEEVNKSITRLNYTSISRFFMQGGFSAGYLLAFLWGVMGLKDGSVTYGLMVAFLQIVGQVQRPVAALSAYIPSFIKALSSQERLLDIEDMQSDYARSQTVLPGMLSLKIENLVFSYDETKKIFDNFSCEFEAGKLSLICGPTGKGKSTLASLILGLLRPQSGHISICPEGHDAHANSVEAGPNTRANFMYVPQGNTLLSGTIRENLLLAKPDATEQELWDALYIAAADFVRELPLGLDSPCSEVGRGFSEGQSQRLSIARALLKEGGILILDEATSALDAKTELAVIERLHERFHGRKTIICITHRMAVSSYADKIINL